MTFLNFLKLDQSLVVIWKSVYCRIKSFCLTKELISFAIGLIGEDHVNLVALLGSSAGELTTQGPRITSALSFWLSQRSLKCLWLV